MKHPEHLTPDHTSPGSEKGDSNDDGDHESNDHHNGSELMTRRSFLRKIGEAAAASTLLGSALEGSGCVRIGPYLSRAAELYENVHERPPRPDFYLYQDEDRIRLLTDWTKKYGDDESLTSLTSHAIATDAEQNEVWNQKIWCGPSLVLGASQILDLPRVPAEEAEKYLTRIPPIALLPKDFEVLMRNIGAELRRCDMNKIDPGQRQQFLMDFVYQTLNDNGICGALIRYSSLTGEDKNLRSLPKAQYKKALGLYDSSSNHYIGITGVDKQKATFDYFEGFSIDTDESMDDLSAALSVKGLLGQNYIWSIKRADGKHFVSDILPYQESVK